MFMDVNKKIHPFPKKFGFEDKSGAEEYVARMKGEKQQSAQEESKGGAESGSKKGKKGTKKEEKK